MITAIFKDGYTIITALGCGGSAAWVIRDRETGRVMESGFSRTIKQAHAEAYNRSRDHAAASKPPGGKLDRPPVIPEVVEAQITKPTTRNVHTAQDVAWLVLNNDHPGHVTVTDDDVQAANELLAYMGWPERVSSVSEDGGMVRFTVDTPVSRT